MTTSKLKLGADNAKQQRQRTLHRADDETVFLIVEVDVAFISIRRERSLADAEGPNVERGRRLCLVGVLEAVVVRVLQLQRNGRFESDYQAGRQQTH